MFTIGHQTKLLVAIGFAISILFDCSSTNGQGISPGEPATNLVLLDIEKGLQVISLHESEAKDTKPQTRAVPTKYVYGEPVGVFGGHLLSLYSSGSSYSPQISGKLFATDLNDGTVRILVPGNVQKAKCVSGQLYFVSKLKKKTKEHTHKLVHIDLETLQSTEVCNLQSEREMMGGPEFSLKVAPNGQTVAVSEMKKRVEPSDSIIARVVFAKAGSSETIKTSYSFRTITIMTGAGDFLKAPGFAWLDNDRLLFTGYSTDGSELKLARGIRIMPHQGEAMRASLIQASDGTISDLCELPKNSFPEVVAAGKGHATICLRRMGLHDLNVATGELKETNSVGSLHLANTKSSEAKPIPLTSEQVASLHENGKLSFGPQRKRLAWFSGRSGIGDFGRALGSKGPGDELYLYEPGRGHQLIYKGRVASMHATATTPVVPFVTWASAAEMEQSQAFMNLDEFKFVKPKTARKDTRPDVNDCLEVDITADREIYQRHAPVKLIITVKNLTDGNYRFEKRRITENFRPFQLENKHPRGRSPVHLFDRDQNVLDAEFLDLPPGETVEFHRTYEVDKTGPQRFELVITHWDIWKGSLKRDVHFEVLEETTPELLRQKFDRALTACLMRWKRTEGRAGLNTIQFRRFGDEGADLLVEFLNQCDDEPLRGELTSGLNSALSDSTLDYLEKRLETDMEQDAFNVVSCVSSVVCGARKKRSAEKFERARKLLLAAGKHRNPKAKFAALQFMPNLPDDVDQFMLKTVDDASDGIATAAARYVAVRQQLPLKDWLVYARNHKGRATELALMSFAKKIASQWDHELDLNEMDGSESDYQQTIAKLVTWCERHPKIAARFFDELPLRTNADRPLPVNKQRDPIVLPEKE